MMTINASYETKVLPGQTFEPSEVYCAPNGVRFWKSFDGMTRKMMTDLLKERTAKKKERDTHPYDKYGEEVPDCFVVDMDAMQKKGFQEPLKRVTDAIGWNWNEIDPTRTTLAMFGMV
jgi:DNA polymerase elongation subunit (family B)